MRAHNTLPQMLYNKQKGEMVIYGHRYAIYLFIVENTLNALKTHFFFHKYFILKRNMFHLVPTQKALQSCSDFVAKKEIKAQNRNVVNAV